MKLILASNSPRRRQILLDNGFKFEVVSSDFAEKSQNLPPQEIVKINALGKAESVFNNLIDKENAVCMYVIHMHTVEYSHLQQHGWTMRALC